jgi:hypothetical protein
MKIPYTPDCRYHLRGRLALGQPRIFSKIEIELDVITAA